LGATDTAIIADTTSGSPQNLQKKNSAQQQGGVPPNNNNKSVQNQQDELLNRYLAESASLKAEINRLQTQVSGMANSYTGTTATMPVIIPVTTAPSVNAQSQNTTDTIYIRDSIRLIDTLRIKDTLTLVKRDTIIRVNKAVPPSVVIKRDTIVTQQAFDFTAIPADIILFDIGSSNIRQVYNKRLDYIAGVLKKHPGLQASITGHTDKSGSPAINTALSLKRAENVAAYLRTKGVPTAQLVTNSLTWLEPAVSGHSKSANSQNRRVVIKMGNN